MTDLISEFRYFLRLSEGLSPPGPAEGPVGAFRTFVDSSTPLVVAAIKNDLDLIAKRANAVADWLMPHDLFRIAGITGDEDAYTDLLAWALSPDAHPATALQRQRAWLQHLGLEFSQKLLFSAIPRTQFGTGDGRLDMILDYGRQGHLVVIETKTGTEEHKAPSGKDQTVAYIKAVRDKLSLAKSIEVHLVFLTPDRRKAVNEEAKLSSFLEFVVALTTAFPPDSFADKDVLGFGLLFTHFVKCTAPNGLNVIRLVRQIVEWSSQPHWKNDDTIASRLGTLLTAKAVLLSERTHGQ